VIRTARVNIDYFNDYGHNCGHIAIEPILMTAIQASKFKAQCLALMDDVARTGKTIVITKNGRPIAELRPHGGTRCASLIGLHKGRVEILKDIVAPVGGDWKVLA
jgi:prevent-host-death family protein